ncbi:MAG: hypothetical protein JWP37_236 [Mucilaginibacter sp.]|nr:hypothetical protein [Mucilaginibacter sp.]
MGKILGFGIFYIAIAWAIAHIWGNNDGTGWINYFCVASPIYLIWRMINGYRKKGLFSKLQINYRASIPCYALLGWYEKVGRQFKKINNPDTITYVLCLCSQDDFYFHECEKDLIETFQFDESICNRINSLIVNVPKKDIINFSYTDMGNNTSKRLAGWIANKVGALLQGYFTNRIVQKVLIDTVVEIHFTRNGNLNVLAFGIPESLVSSSSLDVFSFAPEIVEKVHGYFENASDIISSYKGDPSHIKQAKKMIMGFLKAM